MGVKKNLTPGADPNVGNHPEGVDENDDWDFYGEIGVEFAQRGGMKRKFPDLQEECRTKKRRAPTKVGEVVELAQKWLRPADSALNTVPSSDAPVNSEEDTTEIAAELNIVKARIAELEYVENITVRRHEELFDKVKRRHAEKMSDWKETSSKM